MRFLISTRAWRSTTPGPTGSRTRRSTTKRCAGRWRPCWPSSATSSVTRRCSGPIVTSGSAQTRELVAQTRDGQRVDTLTTLLTAITGRRYGLPQQNHTSDVLAEAYIDVLERRLHRGVRDSPRSEPFWVRPSTPMGPSTAERCLPHRVIVGRNDARCTGCHGDSWHSRNALSSSVMSGRILSTVHLPDNPQEEACRASA